MKKICKICCIEKSLDLFHNRKSNKDGKEIYCKECICKRSKEKYREKSKHTDYKIWKENNPIKYKEYHKQYRKDNKVKINNQLKKWYQENKEKHLKNTTKRKKERYNNDIQFKLNSLSRGRISDILRRNNVSKNNPSIKYLGCSIKEYKQHLEKQFLPEMNWNNHGKIWEIDHIKPISKFDLTTEENIYKAFNYINIQPLFKTTEIAESFGYENHIGNRNKGANY